MKLKELMNKEEISEEQEKKYIKKLTEYIEKSIFSGKEILEIARGITEDDIRGFPARVRKYFLEELIELIEKKEDIKK